MKDMCAQRARRLLGVGGAVGALLALAACGGDSDGGGRDARVDLGSAWSLGVATAQATQQAVATARTQQADFSALPRGGTSRASGLASVCDSGNATRTALDPAACDAAGFDLVDEASLLTFDQCVFDDVLLDGTADYCVGRNERADEEGEFDDVTAAFYNEPFSGVIGGICSDFVDYSVVCTLTGGEQAACSTDGEIVSGIVARDVGALEVTGDEGSGFEVAGSLAVAGEGVVQVETLVPVGFADCPLGLPAAGSVAFDGADGTSGVVDFLSCDDYRVSFAPDEMTAPTCSPALAWDDIYGGPACPVLPDEDLPVGACL